VHEAEPALNLTTAVAPLRDPRVALGPGSPDQRAGAVSGTALRALYRRSLCL
jgi:hypothetical protein